MNSRVLCEHYHEDEKCKECANYPKVSDVVYWLLCEYDWVSSEQTKKEFVQELEQRIRFGNSIED